MFCTCNHDIWQTSFRLGPIHFRWLSAWSERASERARSATIDKLTSIPPKQPLKSTHRHHVCCLEIRGSHVRGAHSPRAPDARRPLGELGANTLHSYNRYLTVAARVVRRSLKDDKRLAAEKRGESDLRFAKWEVRIIPG
jgi:hypothetical protein